MAEAQVQASSTTAPPPPLIEIFVDEAGDRLIPSGKMSREMTRIFYGRLTTATSWTKVSRDVQQAYFEEFRKKFYWTPEIEGAIQSAFRNQAGARYNDLVNRAKHSFTTNTNPPSNVSAEVWAVWTAHWSTEEFKKKSKQYSVNRMTEVDGPGTGPSKHTCGSKSIRQYEQELTQKMGKTPNISEVFLHTHTTNRDGVNFIDQRSLNYSTHYQQEVEMRRTQSQSMSEGGSSTPVEINPDDVYLELVSQKKKKRLYDAGHSSARAKAISSSYSSEPQGTSSTHTPEYQSYVNEAIKQAMLEHTDAVTQRLDTMNNTIHTMLENMMSVLKPNQQ